METSGYCLRSAGSSDRSGMVETTDRRVQTVCLLILTAIALGAALFFLRPVLIPFTLAVFLTYCLAPVIDAQTRLLHIGRTAALINTVLLGMIVGVLLWFLGWQTVEQIRVNINAYEGQVQNVLDDLLRRLPLEKVGIDQQQAVELFRLTKETARGLATGITSLVTTLLSNSVLVILLMVFLMTGRVHTAPVRGGLLWQIEANVKLFLVRRVFMCAITGALVWMVLAILGVPLALAFGVLTFLLNFIPSFGSIIATLLPLPVILLDPTMGAATKVLAFAIPAAVQFAIGNFIDPKVMGGSLDLHPVVVLLGLMFFGMIWGIVGMFLATPIVAVIKIVLEQIPVTAPVAAALAGRMDRALAGFGTSVYRGPIIPSASDQI